MGGVRSRNRIALTALSILIALAPSLLYLVVHDLRGAQQTSVAGVAALLMAIGLVAGLIVFVFLDRRFPETVDHELSAEESGSDSTGDGEPKPPERPPSSPATVSRSFLEQLLDNVHDGVLFLSNEMTILSANNEALKLLDYRQGQLSGHSLNVLVPEGSPGFMDNEGRLRQNGELEIASRGGNRLEVAFKSGALQGAGSNSTGYVLVLRDITDESRTRRRVRYLTRFDPLTRVANRIQFQHKLQQAIARASKNGLRVALLYVDLDRFKDVNDTFGHPVGDRSLEITARRLVDALDPGTLVGRLAGDEFAILLDALPSGEDLHPALAATARMILDRIAKEFYVERRELFVTASLGIALCPDDADNVVDLIRNADAAMYHAKENGGNTYGFYAPRMNADAVDRLVLKNELRHAMLRGELQVLYQPKVDLTNGRVAGAEALLRWRHPKRGEVPPSVFIPLAEDSGLIFEIGAWVLDQVCRDYANWQTRLAWPGRVAVNLSLQQLRQKDFVSRVERIFENHNLTPSCLELEITESTLMRDGERTLKLLDRLYQLGLHLCIDDFGTGYSSLSSLQNFPIGTLKIDQSFVRNATRSTDSAALITTIINMGQSMGMDVVAEGVETEEQLTFLRDQACAYGQGHLFGDPLSGDAYLKILVEQQRGETPLAVLFT
jgi:diguanylate cyclase (GGDEF)-like protein/PAS domain S-box-containing protein